MWPSVRHSCGFRQRRMIACLEVLDRRTLLSGIFPDGRHADAGTAQAWIDTKGAPSRGHELDIACLTQSTIFSGVGNLRLAANVGNNPLY
jgi:hypothetical protein